METTATSPIEDMFWRYGPAVIEGYYWLLMIVGIGLGVWAFLRTRNKGYVFVSLFFVLSLWSAASYRYIEESYELEDYEGDVPEGAIHQRFTMLSLPIAETLLVLGVYFVSMKQISANKSVVTTPDAPRPTS